MRVLVVCLAALSGCTVETTNAYTIIAPTMAAFMGPVLLLWLTGRQALQKEESAAELRRVEKEAEYARQDLVADRLMAVTELAAKRQRDDVARLAKETADQLARSAAEAKREKDEVARVAAVTAQAATNAAMIATASSEAVTAKLSEVAEAAQRVAAVADEKLNVIHTLVNSTLTTALRNELDALVGQLVVMQELADLKHAQGRVVSPKATTLQNELEEKIKNLKKVLQHREEQTQLATAELQQAKAGGAVHPQTSAKPPPTT